MSSGTYYALSAGTAVAAILVAGSIVSMVSIIGDLQSFETDFVDDMSAFKVCQGELLICR